MECAVIIRRAKKKICNKCGGGGMLMSSLNSEPIVSKNRPDVLQDVGQRIVRQSHSLVILKSTKSHDRLFGKLNLL